MSIKTQTPAAFHADHNTTLWVMADIVAVLNLHHAEVVFSYVNTGVTVYGIKGTLANRLTSYDDAVTFFEDAE